ncbi:hypothetical protein DXX93_00830 [Thalassotalea euphylliae]|uniref:Peptidase M14 domain-containing protein n=1 Tax=Thalassotalea euphylliae TaxID=1655234 RepID=A0A3E0TL18_9GAMM|nr:M14 family zinc carboxypeptidase [Thalassotalea euphylliae]REL25244.1 hypothetical protein DXX93_00830 [Thalassotalea euphylliae]
MFFQQILNRCLTAGAAIYVAACSLVVNAAELSYYLPDSESYSAQISKPSQVLGVGVGERHLRHDQLLAYMSEIAGQSERIKLTEFGRTYQQRKQVLLTISSPENLANLDSILANRQSDTVGENDPIVVWLGYSVHGDEISGAHASMLVAYYLAAAQGEEVNQWLNDMVVVIEPSVNPDGMDRFANWVATFRGNAANSDPNHIEHNQSWPTGRTNHYWFDLNRDWLLLSQVESVNRLKMYHQYQPNVLGDFHEMGANSSYFFQPGIPTRTNPLTPTKNVELTQTLAEFHAKALDNEQRLYYTQESFDDFYYGKGSTYPDVNGAVGILFEQASSRGAQQDTVNGLLTFEYGIKNQLLTSFSTLRGAWQQKAVLAEYRQHFYESGLKQAKKEKYAGYLFTESKDNTRLNLFLSKLAQHQIDVFPLTEDFRLNNRVFSAEHSYFVPLAQRQYRLIQALFTKQTEFVDNTFYDVSGWTLPLAMNIDTSQVARTWGLKLADQPWQEKTWQKGSMKPSDIAGSAYAYAIEWQDYLAPKLLNKLLAKGLQVKVATKSFTSVITGKERAFAAGTLLIAAGIQEQSDWFDVLKAESDLLALPVLPLNTGLTIKGIDLGSHSFKLIEQPKVLLVGGYGVSQYEAGEVRYYLDQELAIPVSIVDKQRLAKLSFDDYTHIVMVDGNYADLSKGLTKKLSSWLQRGGVVFAQKRGAKWLAEKELLKTSFASKEQLDQLFDSDALNYEDKQGLAARKRIAGTIFAAQIDTSHPLAFGFQDKTLPVFKNSSLIMNKPKVPFATVAKFGQTPLLSGYADENLVNRMAHNASLVAHNVGRGRVIATTENLTFRGYWQGTAKVLANSLFFAHAFDVAAKP